MATREYRVIVSENWGYELEGVFMRKSLKGRKFGRTSSVRKALLVGLAKSLVQYERIRTTLPKAKDLKPFIERLITIAKENTLANRRRLLAVFFNDNKIVSKMMSELATRYAKRNGGYTRIYKAGFRQGDNAPVGIIELVDNKISFLNKKTEDTEIKE